MNKIILIIKKNIAGLIISIGVCIFLYFLNNDPCRDLLSPQTCSQNKDCIWIDFPKGTPVKFPVREGCQNFDDAVNSFITNETLNELWPKPTYE